MIEFKENFKKILPYNREKYLRYLDDDPESSEKWYGASFQRPEITELSGAYFETYLKLYKPLFKNIVSEFNHGSFWIVNHEDKDLPWFPNKNDSLPHLRTLFREHNVLDTFKGALIFSAADLINFSEDLISYPFIVTGKKGSLYKNLDVSNSALQIIIKISGHLNIDFLSKGKPIFEKIKNGDFANGFLIKEYRDDLPR